MKQLLIVLLTLTTIHLFATSYYLSPSGGDDSFANSKQLPVAAFTDSVSLIGCGITNMQFIDQSIVPAPMGWNWNFGDGNSAIQQNPSHPYTVPGTYAVSLIVIDSAGFTDTATNNVIVPGPAGTFSFTPSVGCLPLTVTYTAVCATAISYTWDFGDGTVITTANSVIQYTYTQDIVAIPALLLGSILPDSSICQVSAPSAGMLTVHSLPNVTFTSVTNPLCVYDSTITLSGNPSGGVFSGTGVSGSNFDPAVSGVGTFTVSYIYSDTNSCLVADSQAVSVSLCTGITSELKDLFILIFPNPATNTISIKLGSANSNQVNVFFYNSIGEKMKTISTTYLNGHTTSDISELQNGIYFIRAMDNKNKSITRSFIKTNE